MLENAIIVMDEGALKAWSNVDGHWVSIALPSLRVGDEVLSDQEFNTRFPTVLDGSNLD